MILEPACEHVEGGRYVGPEFQLGQVYDGGPTTSDTDVVLYRPVYVCVSTLRSHLKNSNNFAANCAKLTQQNSRERNNASMVAAASTVVPTLTVTSTGADAPVQQSQLKTSSWLFQLFSCRDFIFFSLEIEIENGVTIVNSSPCKLSGKCIVVG